MTLLVDFTLKQVIQNFTRVRPLNVWRRIGILFSKNQPGKLMPMLESSFFHHQKTNRKWHQKMISHNDTHVRTNGKALSQGHLQILEESIGFGHAPLFQQFLAMKDMLLSCWIMDAMVMVFVSVSFGFCHAPDISRYHLVMYHLQFWSKIPHEQHSKKYKDSITKSNKQINQFKQSDFTHLLPHQNRPKPWGSKNAMKKLKCQDAILARYIEETVSAKLNGS